MKIEIWSDIVCPFCYLGKRRLEKALAGNNNAQNIEIEWKSFLLNPDQITNPDLELKKYLSNTKGWSDEQTDQMFNQVTSMAVGEGLEYNFNKAVVANSKKAHRLLQYAKTNGLGDQLKERLLLAYFSEGVNIDENSSLLRLASEIQLDREEVKNVLNTQQFDDKVEKDIYESRQIGVRGVPFFVLNGKYAISGAQSVEVFEQAIDQAWNEFNSEKVNLEVVNSEGDSCDIEGNC